MRSVWLALRNQPNQRLASQPPPARQLGERISAPAAPTAAGMAGTVPGPGADDAENGSPANLFVFAPPTAAAVADAASSFSGGGALPGYEIRAEYDGLESDWEEQRCVPASEILSFS
eukprot:SAG22_NODE_3167_length_1885_cov_2.585666_1_plen_117_part_00